MNLISRKDFEHLYERHILHSLGIAKVVQFKKGTRIIDVGTGGGFTLVPLAIMFPRSTFHGIDGTGKKISAVKGVIEGLALTNCTAEQVRSTDHNRRYNVIVKSCGDHLAGIHRYDQAPCVTWRRPHVLSERWRTGRRGSCLCAKR